MTGFTHPCPPRPKPHQAGQHHFPAPPPFAETAAQWSRSGTDADRRWRTALNMMAVFVVGVGAGLAATWWLNAPLPGAGLQAPQQGETPVDRVIEPAAVPATGDGALPAGELPFDGRPASEAALPKIPYHIEVPASPSSLSTATNHDAALSNASPNAPHAVQKERDKVRAAAAVERSPPSRAEASAPGTANAVTKPVAKASHSTQRSTQRSASRAPTLPAESRVKGKGVNPEIDRLRQQAVDELWRKRIRERMPDQGRAPADGALPPFMQPA